MEIRPLKTEILEENFDLAGAVEKSLVRNRLKPRNGDVIVISSKVASLAEGRVVELNKIKPSKKALDFSRSHSYLGDKNPQLVELIYSEADTIFHGPVITTIKNGIVIPSAGIDQSNSVKGKAILWPRDSWKIAYRLWQALRKKFRLQKFGVIICDSHCQPLRWGTTGVALAWMGFEGIEDARNTKDIYGKPLRVTKKAVADNLSSGSLVIMGEAGERIPFALVRGAPIKFTNRRPQKNEVFVPPNECIFGGMYAKKVKG